MICWSHVGATLARKIAPMSPSGAPIRMANAVDKKEPRMKNSAPYFPDNGSHCPEKKNSSGLTSANVCSPCLPTKKMIAKITMDITQATAPKNQRPHVS